jgi:lipopolysaccharide assembly outer membrane protein LptD (OstA)
VAELKIENNHQVKIFSDFAIYNIITNDTQFFQNVILNYEDHKLICQKMDLNFLKKIVTLSEDLLYRNSNIKLIADKIKINFITKKIIAEMLDDKANIKIISINGINQKIQN